MTDPFAELRATRDRALAARTGDALVDDYERGAIAISWADLTGEELGPGTSSLRVDLSGLTVLDAHISATVNELVQKATALVGKSIKDHEAATTSVYPHDRHRAQLIVRESSGNTLNFGFSEDDNSVPSILDGMRLQTLAEQAALGLVQRLPENAEDDASLDAILGGAPAIRSAMSAVVKAARATHGLVLRFQGGDGKVAFGQLDSAQANRLEESLRVTQIARSRQPTIGLLDGVRTQRRIFYLILDDDSEITGTVDEDMLSSIREFEDRRVEAILEVSQSTDRSGRRGRRAYRLIGLQDAPFDLTQEPLPVA